MLRRFTRRKMRFRRNSFYDYYNDNDDADDDDNDSNYDCNCAYCNPKFDAEYYNFEMNTDIDLYNLRKQSHVKQIKGVITHGKTIRSRSGRTFSCNICKCSVCEHVTHPDYKDLIYKYTTDSRLQKKNVRKCDCCSTHVCTSIIPIRGRHIKPEMNDELY